MSAGPAALGVVTSDCHGRRMTGVGEPRHDIQSQGPDFRGSKEREAHRKATRPGKASWRMSESWPVEGTQDASPMDKGPEGPPVPGAGSVSEAGSLWGLGGRGLPLLLS